MFNFSNTWNVCYAYGAQFMPLNVNSLFFIVRNTKNKYNIAMYNNIRANMLIS